jgi:hypothetical protein
MADLNAMVQQAIAEIKANRKAEGRQILEQVLAIDEYNEQAWLWLSGCVETLEEQLTCLENVLTINPGNQKAIRGAATLREKIAARTAPPASRPISPFTSDPFAESPFAEAPFGSAPATPPTGSSVEWGGAPGSVPAYGSGKHVDLPTDEEYDQWLANLPIGSNSSSSAVYGADAFTTSSGDTGPFTAPPDAVDYGATDAFFASSPPAPDPFDTFSPVQAFDSYHSPRTEPSVPIYDAAPAPSEAPYEPPSGPFGDPFDMDEAEPLFADDDLDMAVAQSTPAGPFTFRPPKTPADPPPPVGAFAAESEAVPARNVFGGQADMVLGSSAATIPAAQLFKAIPPEIQIAGAAEGPRLLITVALLGVANSVSIIVLLTLLR